MGTGDQPVDRMNHLALVRAVAQEAGVPQQTVAKVLRATFDVIGRKVAEGGRVNVTNFGSWFLTTIPHTHNPQTLEKLGPVRVARFKARGRLAQIIKSGGTVTTLKKDPSS